MDIAQLDREISDLKQSGLSVKPLFITLLLMIGLAFFIKSNLGLIESVPASVSETVFSAERAKNMLSDLLKEQVPHPVDSQANRIVESRIIDKLRAMGYQEEIQQTKECRDYEVGVARCVQVRNIIVSIDGTQKSKGGDKNGILLAAHYDSVGAGPGANDAGVAVATLLEVARLLALEERPKNSIVLLFNEGEEFGLFGAHAFMRQHPLAKTLKLAINIEARGSDGQSVMFETGENSGWLVEAYINSTPAPLSSSLFYEVYKILPNDTDLTVFKEHGLQGLNFAHADNEPHYHTPLDNLENLQLGTIQHHGDNVWGVLKSIKDKELSNLNEENIVYTDIIGQFVIKWQESTSLIVSIIIFGLFIVVARSWVKASKLNSRSIRRGVYAFFTIFVLLPAVALLVQKLTQLVSGGSTPWRVDNFPMQLTLWASLTYIGLLVGRWFAKKVCPVNFLFGLLICWIVLAIVTSVLMVGISYLFIVPSFVAVIILLLLPILNRYFSNKAKAVSLVVISLVVGIMFLPIVYVLELMVSYQMSMAIGLMLSFVISSMTPLMAVKSDTLKQVNKLSYGLVVMFLIGFILTITQPAHTVFIPQAINITHIQTDDGQSLVLAGTVNSPPSEKLRTAMKDPQVSQAVAWSSVLSFNQEVENLALAPAKVEVISNLQKDNEKVVQLSIGAEDTNFRDLFLYVAGDSKLKTISYSGKELTYSDEKAWRNGYYEFQCRGLSCQSMVVTLTFSSQSKKEVIVVKSLSGLPASEAVLAENRGDAAVQRQFGDRTAVITKVEL